MLIDSQSGKLEIKLSLPEVSAQEGHEHIRSVVLCHPHPLFGGSMQNKVVHTLAKTTATLGHRAIRFNFRGVGLSEGQFDNGVGEREDLSSVIQYILARFPADPIVLAGFSFGAFVAAELCIQRGNEWPIEALCLVAPPIGRLSFSSFAALEIPLTVIAAENDELVPLDSIQRWRTDIAVLQQFSVIQGASHFFHGKLRQLSAAFEPFVLR